MSYDPSHRMPPRQERWPQATPAEGWTPYREGEAEPAGRRGSRAQQAAGSHRRKPGARSGVATAAFPAAGDAYETADSYGTDGYRTGDYAAGTEGYAGYADDFAGNGYSSTNGGYAAGAQARGGYGYAGTAAGYADATDGFDGTADGPAAGADGFSWAKTGYADTADGYARAPDGYVTAGNGYAGTQYGYGRGGDGYTGTADAYAGAANAYAGAANGYADAPNGYAGAPDGYPSDGAYLGPGSYTETTYPGPGYSDSGYADSGYSGSGYTDAGQPDPGYSDPGYSDPGYSEPGYSDSGYFGSGYSDQTLTAPDAGMYPDDWQADQARRRAARNRGLMVSAATEFLATAVVIGVSTLAAGLLKSSVSPVSALGAVFIDRTPAVLRGFAAHHFGTHGHTVLLLGMYAMIAVTAIIIGVAARRAAALSVTGIAAFALIAAFAAVTRPASHASDVMPAVIGGLAGVAALLWLVRASAPVQEVSPLRAARGGTRRRTR